MIQNVITSTNVIVDVNKKKISNVKYYYVNWNKFIINITSTLKFMPRINLRKIRYNYFFLSYNFIY